MFWLICKKLNQIAYTKAYWAYPKNNTQFKQNKYSHIQRSQVNLAKQFWKNIQSNLYQIC